MIFTTIKHKILKIAVLSCCILNIGCNNDIIPSDPTGIKGELVLKLKAGDVKTEIITRSTLDIDINSFKINLSENDGTPLFVNKLYGELNETDCTLPAESGYQITAESCSQDESVTQNGGYGYPRFVGEATFNIKNANLLMFETRAPINAMGGFCKLNFENCVILNSAGASVNFFNNTGFAVILAVSTTHPHSDFL